MPSTRRVREVARIRTSTGLHWRILRYCARVTDWGSVPDWLAGVGAVLALMFAALAVRAVRHTNRQQAIQLEQQAEQLRQQARQLAGMEESRRREQAEKVAAWISIDESLLEIKNTAESPVYDVHIYVMGTASLTSDGAIEGPSEYLFLELVRPSAEPIRRSLIDALMGSDGLMLTGRVAITFRDAAGLMWERDALGNLRQHTSRSLLERRAELRDMQKAAGRPSAELQADVSGDQPREQSSASTRATFANTDLRGALFASANLTEARFLDANLTGAQLNGRALSDHLSAEGSGLGGSAGGDATRRVVDGRGGDRLPR